ncbi:hypothetical protein [Rhodanobacter sp. T12-5]|uniref:hypothetical protein n=1 Tax=Rhodanobacter sp. T12-5 TaxID=2024611 RepID=UPI0011EC26EA|nr:hypothetical protein [Rhodanobacter sp. T12-5]
MTPTNPTTPKEHRPFQVRLETAAAEGFKLRQTAAQNTCLSDAKKTVEAIKLLATFNDLPKVVHAYNVMYERLVAEEMSVLTSFLVTDSEVDSGPASTEVRAAFATRLNAVADAVKADWATNVETYLLIQAAYQQDDKRKELLVARSAELDAHMLQAASWQRVDFGNKAEAILRERAQFQLSRATTQATQSMDRSAAATKTLTKATAWIASLALVAYCVQAYFAGKQAEYAKDALYIAKCTSTNPVSSSLLPDIKCPEMMKQHMPRTPLEQSQGPSDSQIRSQRPKVSAPATSTAAIADRKAQSK